MIRAGTGKVSVQFLRLQSRRQPSFGRANKSDYTQKYLCRSSN